MRQLKTTISYSLTILEARNLKSTCKQDYSPSERSSGESNAYFFQLLVTVLAFLNYGGFISISASVFISPFFFVCLC